MADDVQVAGAPKIITSNNISLAWGEALLHINDNPGNSISPLLFSIPIANDDAELNEDGDVRGALDDFLASKRNNGCFPVKSVGFTIFPQIYWKVADGDRQELYQTYKDALPHIKAKYPKLNNKGLYFERMIAFDGARTNENQLEYMIEEYLSDRRRASKFQVTIYDPKLDQHTGPYQTFPCLQNVNFVFTEDGLVLNAFYAMQYLVRRAYGNMVGLIHLGQFMAHELGLDLARVNIMAGTEKLDFSKGDVSEIVDVVRGKMGDE